MFFSKGSEDSILQLSKPFWLSFLALSVLIVVVSLTLLIVGCVSFVYFLDVATLVDCITRFLCFAGVMIVIFGTTGLVIVVLFAIRLRQSSQGSSVKAVSIFFRDLFARIQTNNQMASAS